MPEDKSLDDIAAGLLFVDEVQKFLALVDAELAVDVAHVGAHGADGEHERLRDAGRVKPRARYTSTSASRGERPRASVTLAQRPPGCSACSARRAGRRRGRIGAGRKYTLVGGSRDCRRVLICRAIARGGPGVACSRMHGRSHSFRNGRFRGVQPARSTTCGRGISEAPPRRRR